jgi:valyl-tRNA synthetase
VAKRHNLPLKQVIGFDGKMNSLAGEFEGLYVKQARRAVVEKMQALGLVERIDENYINRVGLCYKCKNVLEPLPLEQWFVKMEPLAKPAIEAVKKGEIKIHPKSFEKLYFQFLENIRDWNISRQVVWGIQIPAWKNKKTNEWMVTTGDAPSGEEWIRDTDTFDTWFSSSQWPFATLMTTEPGDFDKFYPTTVMETGYDILRWWVARMVMMGLYVTGKVPFKNVVLHGLVNDPYGKKMSKSKGNVVNPLELVDEYGADAVRFALVYGTALGNDQALSYPKLEAARRFTNKLWNMTRFVDMKRETLNSTSEILSNLEIGKLRKIAKHETDRVWVNKVSNLVTEVSENLESYQFNQVSEKLYEFVWHQFADIYIEDVKNRIDENSFVVLNSLFITLVSLLHPMMPFVTDEIYKKLTSSDKSLMIAPWPEA